MAEDSLRSASVQRGQGVCTIARLQKEALPKTMANNRVTTKEGESPRSLADPPLLEERFAQQRRDTTNADVGTGGGGDHGLDRELLLHTASTHLGDTLDAAAPAGADVGAASNQQDPRATVHDPHSSGTRGDKGQGDTSGDVTAALGGADLTRGYVGVPGDTSNVRIGGSISGQNGTLQND